MSLCFKIFPQSCTDVRGNEYDFMGFGTQSTTFTGCGGTCVVSANAKADVQKVLGGVNYKFNF
jgi:hypothetical protein